MSLKTLGDVRSFLIGRLAHLTCKKVVILRHLRLRVLRYRIDCLEKVLCG